MARLLKRSGSGRVLVVGSANMDVVLRVGHLPVPGETVGGGSLAYAFGGKGANQAVAASRFARTSFITSIGYDAHGSEMLKSWQQAGIDISGVLQTDRHPTGTALIMVDDKGTNFIGVAPGANKDLLEHGVHLAVSRIPLPDVILFQAEIDPSTVQYLSHGMIPGDPLLIFNYAPVTSPVLADLSGIGILVVNETEAGDLTGAYPDTVARVERAAQLLRGMGPAAVVVTMGANGLIAATEDGLLYQKAPKVEAVDTTGAGDAFCGTLAAVLAVREELPEALTIAQCAAALSVTRPGAQTSIGLADEVREFRRSLRHCLPIVIT
jgi:ribokinase